MQVSQNHSKEGAISSSLKSILSFRMNLAESNRKLGSFGLKNKEYYFNLTYKVNLLDLVWAMPWKCHQRTGEILSPYFVNS